MVTAAALAGAPGRGPRKAPWGSGHRADGGIVLGTAVADRRRGAREVGAEAARLDDRHLDPERPDLFREHLREAFDAPLGGGIGGAAGRPEASGDGGQLDDVTRP